MKCEEIAARFPNKVSVSSYNSRKVTILEESKFHFQAIRVGKNATILGNLTRLK